MVAIPPNIEKDWELRQEDIFESYSRKEKDLKLEPLCKSIESSYRGLEPFRNLNRRLVAEYAGPAYGDNTSKRKYLNMTAQLVDAYMMLLAANRPKCDITTRYETLKGYASHFEVGVNNLIEEIGIEFTIRRWVLEAFFSIGIVKAHQKDSGDIQFEKNLWMDPGTPFASNVSLDNFVYDPGARSWGELRWAGDMYRVPLGDIAKGVELGMYDPEVAKSVKPTSKFMQDKQRLEEFSKGGEVDLDEYEPMVSLADVWVKSERCIYTFVVLDQASFKLGPEPIAHLAWDDPESGPYHILGFSEVPENVMPVGPAVHMDEMDRLLNNLLRKEARKAMRQKDHILFDAASAETAKRMKNNPDGGMIQGSPDGVRPVSEGGANAANMMFFGNVLELYKNACGGLDTLRGTGAAAGTVGQEQLIHDAANRSIAQMQYRVMDATRRLLKSLAFMLWHDEFKEIAGTIQIEGTPYKVDATWKPGDREGNFFDYNFDVNVYSMAYRPPAQRADGLIGIIERVIAPLMPNLMQQGGQIDVARLLNRLAEDLDMPALKDVVSFTAPPEDAGASPSVTTKPPNTTRTYNRSIPSGTAHGAGQMMQQQWASMATSNGGASMTPMA